MHRQNDSTSRVCETRTGCVTLKKSFHDSSVGTEDFNEMDLKNSIQSIDWRLSVLVGQTQQMFAAQQKVPK